MNCFLESDLGLICRIFHLTPLNPGNVPAIVTDSLKLHCPGFHRISFWWFEKKFHELHPFTVRNPKGSHFLSAGSGGWEEFYFWSWKATFDPEMWGWMKDISLFCLTWFTQEMEKCVRVQLQQACFLLR